MAEVLQKGNSPVVPVTLADTLRFYGQALSGGKAGQAAQDLKTRGAKIESAVDQATGAAPAASAPSTMVDPKTGIRFADGGQIGHGPAPKKPNPPFKPFGTMPDATPR